MGRRRSPEWHAGSPLQLQDKDFVPSRQSPVLQFRRRDRGKALIVLCPVLLALHVPEHI